jgi:hypothetical protein
MKAILPSEFACNSGPTHGAAVSVGNMRTCMRTEGNMEHATPLLVHICRRKGVAVIIRAQKWKNEKKDSLQACRKRLCYLRRTIFNEKRIHVARKP